MTREGILKLHLPLSPRDFLAETPDEWLIMYADKLHTKAISIESRTISPAGLLVKKYGTPDLDTLADKYGLKVK